jgi:exodeoxyribonuclease-3
VKKGFYDVVRQFDADVFMVQETKATVDIVKDIGKELNGYQVLANEAEKKGYSGTAVFTKLPVLSEFYKINKDEHDQEGRIIGVEFEKFFLVNVYVPNSGSELARLDYRKTWDVDFLRFLKKLNEKKPVIVGGDFNVAHRDIDLARPKPNYDKTAGYTQTEIDGMDNFTKAGLIDSFRALHPDKVLYSFWSQRFGARKNNVGWRIDYFLLSPELKDNLASSDIYNDVMGSDHCPVSVELKF